MLPKSCSICAGLAAAVFTALCHLPEIALFVLKIHDNESGGVPQLVGEVTARFQPVFFKTHIISRSYTCGEHESQSVCPVLIYDLEGIYAVSRDLLIFRPSASLTRPWTYTWWKGASPIASIPEKTILTTQKNIISYPCHQHICRIKYLRSLVSSGQPSVENGQRADENHVSSTSSSCLNAVPPHLWHFSGSSAATVSWLHS